MRTAQGQNYSYDYAPGGNAKNHHIIISLKLTRLTGEKMMLIQDGEEYGHIVEVYAEKNQTTRPHKKTNVNLIWGVGFDNYTTLVRIALLFDVVVMGGSWFTYTKNNGEILKIQGEKQLAKAFASDLELYNEIYAKTLEKIGA
jgi:hypothetical protein